MAQAFILGESFIGNDDVCLILGDNVFYGGGLPNKLKHSVKEVKNHQNAVIFGYYVNDPERYGVIEFDENEEAVSIEEKPLSPRSNYAVSGIYFYPNDAGYCKKTETFSTGVEITDVNKKYLLNKKQSRTTGAWICLA